MLAINDLFPAIEKAQDAINRHVLDEGESYKVYKCDGGGVNSFDHCANGPKRHKN